MSSLDVQIGGGHYKELAIQPVEYIHKNNLGFIEGCVVKYVTRWRDKGGLNDLRKAVHFLQILIELESGGETQKQVRDVCTGVSEAEQEPDCGVRAGEVGVHGPSLRPPVYSRYQINPTVGIGAICRVEGEAGYKHEKEDGPRQGPASR